MSLAMRLSCHRKGESMWGYPCEYEGPDLYWGARAIFESGRWEGLGTKRQKYYPPRIDLVYDRQTFGGNGHPDKEKFIEWISKKALPACKRWAEHQTLDSRQVFTFMDDGFVLMASPNGSYGYLYIGAWPNKPGKETEDEHGANEKG